MNMRFHLVPSLLVASFSLVLSCAADPILPFQLPIATQLTNDINANNGDVKNLNKALDDYHKTSKSLGGDISILRNLDKKLNTTAGYPLLLSDSAVAYQDDFGLRRDELNAQILPAPLGVNRTSARASITKVDKALSNAVHSATTTARINNLKTAADRLASASNAVQRALKARPGYSTMTARIGALAFQSEKGRVTGGADFLADEGNSLVQFGGDGVLTVSAVDNGSVVRGLHLHVEGVTTNFPALYLLDVDGNRGFYDATDLSRRQGYVFQADRSLTNGVITNAFVTIDFIGSNYLTGRFAFGAAGGPTLNPGSSTDTNTTVSISGGEFQINLPRFNTNTPPVNTLR